MFIINKYAPSEKHKLTHTHILGLSDYVDGKLTSLIEFGPITYLLSDIYDDMTEHNNHDNLVISKLIFGTPNEIISLLNREDRKELVNCYNSINTVIETNYNEDELSKLIYDLISLTNKFSLEEIFCKEDIDKINLLFHATDTVSKEFFGKKDYQDLIKLSVVMKFIIPIVNRCHTRFINYDTIFFSNMIFKIIYELFPVVRIIRDRIRYVVSATTHNNSHSDFKYNCILLERDIYLYLVTYYDTSLISENNNIINIITNCINNEVINNTNLSVV